jgi:putative IMPACT (imprinted ancient) family translation regulator
MTLGYNGSDDVNKALQFIGQFEKKETGRAKNGFFYKPKKALAQACEDCRDVMESMRRYEGVESV